MVIEVYRVFGGEIVVKETEMAMKETKSGDWTRHFCPWPIISDTIHYDNIGGCFIDSITLNASFVRRMVDGCLKIDSTKFPPQHRLGRRHWLDISRSGQKEENSWKRRKIRRKAKSGEKRFAEQTNQLGQVIEANLSIKFIIYQYLPKISSIRRGKTIPIEQKKSQKNWGLVGCFTVVSR